MHKTHKELEHDHIFQPAKFRAERRTAVVFYITIITMIVEIIVGYMSRSMALFAHAAALGITFVAYGLARNYAHDHRFAFGTWKIEILGSYTSAIILGIVGLSMIVMSITRFFKPEPIAYNEAIVVAIVGLIVNLVCALILAGGRDTHHHDHAHVGRDHAHLHHSTDLNLKAALIHVATDAMTSVLAIIALLGAKFLRLTFLDPLMGIVGALLIAKWTWGLLKDSTGILVDKEMDSPIVAEIKRVAESDGTTRVSDLHVWRVAQTKYSCIITLARTGTATIADYKSRLKEIAGLVHVSIELHRLESVP
jgi:cation diffusion facilitator family transporter